jgi:hypothetical protein
MRELSATFWREILHNFGGNYFQVLAGIMANFWRENAESLHVVSIPELSVLRFGGIIVHRSVLWIIPISHIELNK